MAAECVLVRAGPMYEGVQGLPYARGVTGATAGATRLCVTELTIAPGGRSRAHLHRAIESVGYVIDGTLETLFGQGLERSVVAGPGDFVFIPPDVPHVVVNRGDGAARALVAHSAANDQEGIVLLPELDELGRRRAR
jgi:uncharacterized RmlC-like cupin family protein